MEAGILKRILIAESRIVSTKCKPVVDELPSVKGWGVSQLFVGHLGWTAFLQKNKLPI